MTEVREEQLQNQAELIKEEILQGLDATQTIEESVMETVSTARTFGKTVDEWYKEMSVPLDPSADPAKIKLYCSQLGNHLDTAYKNLAKAKLVDFNYKLSYNIAFNEKLAAQALNKSRKVAPAIETMSKVAESQLPERAITAKRCEMAIEFWQDMVWKLKNKVSIVNTMSMANGTMGKVGEFYG